MAEARVGRLVVKKIKYILIPQLVKNTLLFLFKWVFYTIKRRLN